MKFLTRLAAVGLVAAMPFTTEAATFDFAQIANDFQSNASNTDEREGTYQQVKDGLGAGVFTTGGISITNIIAGGSNNAGVPAHTFFDGLNGLGVCSSGFSSTETVWTGSDMSQCSSNGGTAPGDGSVTGDEFLVFNFDRIIGITDSLWRDGNGGLFSGSLFYASDTDGSIGGETAGLLTLLDGRITNVGAGSNGLDRLNIFGFFMSNSDDKVYLSSLTAVPLPAGLPLLLGGLGALGFAARRKKKQA